MNDLFLSWFMIVALWALLSLKHKAVVQGIIIATCLWLGFHTKLWVVYIFPLFFTYYALQIIKYRKWKGAISFILCSVLLYSAISIFWKIKVGSFLPFLNNHAAHNIIIPSHLVMLFKIYPHMIFKGSEFGTTLFGVVPYLLLIALTAKLVLRILFSQDNKIHWDSLDFWLFFYYMSFFLLLNFFPNAFTFTEYYSVPRIFRYLTPISFPMTLHLAKLIIDIYTLLHKHVKLHQWATIITFCLLIGLNIYHTFEATRHGRSYHKNLKLIVQEIKQTAPPVVVSEMWLSGFLESAYLKSQEDKTQVLRLYGTKYISEYEAWLDQNESTLPEGSMLISGLVNYVFYATHQKGFLLNQFSKPLSSNWKVHKEFGTLDYLPVPEQVKLWKLVRQEELENLRALELENY